MKKVFAITKFSWPHRVVMVLAVLLVILVLWQGPPQDFPLGQPISIVAGSNLSEIGEALREAGVVRSAEWFKLIVKLRGADVSLQAGDYTFEKPLTSWAIASRLEAGVFSTNPLKITVPEGLNMRELASLFQKQLPHFDLENFLRVAEASEGELIPDTYFFSPLANETAVIKMMQENFARQLEPYQSEIVTSGRSPNEILVMASLLEEEARTAEDKRVIAGILWKRIADGMPLQVDAVFPYIIGKNSFELTRADLKVDSPYNTYLYPGLPPGPITNPGLDSILAALRPETSPYWFYLSDHYGNMHYAVNYKQHKQNKATYLD